MARIQTYDKDNTVTGEDKILGTDENNKTKNFTPHKLAEFIKAFVEIGSGERYFRQENPPISVGGFSSDEPATGELGLSFVELADKLLFPSVPPELSLQATPQPLFNQPTPYTVNLSWTIVIGSVGAGLSSLSLDWRRVGGTYSNLTTDTSLSSFEHQIDTLSNVDIEYRLTVTDTQGGSNTIEITRIVEDYTAPSANIVRNPSGVLYERGKEVTISGDITRNTQYSPLSNYKLEREINGVWDVVNPLINSSGSFGGSITIPSTVSTNINSTSSTRFRVRITDTESTDITVFTSPLIYLRQIYYYGPTNGIPTSLINLNLSEQFDNNNTINLSTGTTLKDFSVILPQGKVISQANDEGNLNNDITSEFINQGDLTLQDAGGNNYTATRFVYSVDTPYSSSSNLKIIIQ